ncbi:TPA: hypothetical protein ACX6PH_000884 [Photobacterium damselae]
MLLCEAERESWQDKVSTHIRNAASRLVLSRYRQEPAYVSAFLARLDGEVEIKSEGKVISFQFLPSVISDRGPRSAESKFGADFSIVFSNGVVEKAILSQAKRDIISSADAKKLEQQCKKMNKQTDHWVVLKMPSNNGDIPQVSFNSDGSNAIPFDTYITDYVISCKHGDRDLGFVDKVQDSDLKGLSVEVSDM